MSKLRKSAMGQECQIRIPGICNHDYRTVVLAHLPSGGTGMKASDIHGAYACSACHAFVDGATHEGWTISEVREAHYDGVRRTQDLMLKAGLIAI